MFQFTTTTLINSLKDFTTGKDLITEKDGVLYIKRQGVYRLDDDHKMCAFKAEGYDAEYDEIDVTPCVGVSGDSVYRLALQIRSNNNADPRFANSLVFKQAPFYVEFKNGEFEANFNKYQNMALDSAVLVLNGNKAVATNEYMRVISAVLEEYNEDKKEFVKVQDLNVTTGKEGFGTYAHLEQSFRLPTAANLRWKGIMEDERPAAGVIYNQYTFHYLVNRGNFGGAAVGQQVTSETTHVFWVPSTLAGEFESKIAALGVTFTAAPSEKTTGVKLYPEESAS